MTSLIVNGVAIAQDAIDREAELFAGTVDPQDAARRSLATRALLLARAGELGLLEGPSSTTVFAGREEEDAVIGQVLDREVLTPAPTEAECRRYYDHHPSEFTSGELVEAGHILFAMTPGTPAGALRATAEKTLAQVRAEPQRFDEIAKQLSNCPSGATGGRLGQFGRGEMVPEFDRALFGASTTGTTGTTGVLPELVTTRYGFHVVLIERRIPGKRVDYGVARERIAARLTEQVQARAVSQYVRLLAGRAQIEGIDLAASASPLLQ